MFEWLLGRKTAPAVDPSIEIEQRLTEELDRRLKETINYLGLPGIPSANYYDPFRPDMDSLYPIGYYRNRNKYGDNPQAYMDDESLRRAREKSRMLSVRNEYARNALSVRQTYIIGTGLRVTAMPRKGTEDDQAAIDLADTVQSYLEVWSARNSLPEKQKESVLRWDRDGEVFMRIAKKDRMLTFRFIEPEHVGDFDGQTSFGIKTAEDDITDISGYLVRAGDGEQYELVKADKIVHCKANTDSGIKRGLPFLYPIFNILDKIEKTDENMAAIIAIQAAIAMIRRNRVARSTAVSSNISSAADYTGTNPYNGNTDRYKVYRPGTILDVDANTEYEFPAIGANIGGIVEAKSSLLRTAAAGVGMPEYMLTSDAANGNFASTQVAESPAIAGFLACQHFWGEVYGQGVWVEGTENGLLWRAIEYAVEQGDLDPATLDIITLKCEGPNIVVRDRNMETQRLQMLEQAGIISRDQWARMEGLEKAAKSDEEMQAQKDAEMQKQMQLKQANQPAKPVKENWDEDKHPRDNDGKFADKGGEGKKENKENDMPLWKITKKAHIGKQTKLNPETDIEDIADAARLAMDIAVGSPKDQCISVAYAIKREFPEAEIWQGYVNGEPHTLAKLSGKYIDVTADQFGKYDTVQIIDPEDMPKEYKKFKREIPEIEFSSGKHWDTEDAIHSAFRDAIIDAAKDNAAIQHKNAVVYAIHAGEKVPDEVLKDYPDLVNRK